MLGKGQCLLFMFLYSSVVCFFIIYFSLGIEIKKVNKHKMHVDYVDYVVKFI